MKKTNFMTAVLLILAVLLMAACSQVPDNQIPATSTTPSSSSQGGALEDNTLFGDGSTPATQPTTGTTIPSTNATVPTTGATQPSTAPTQPSTQATVPATKPTEPAKPGDGMDYLTFQNMSGAEQRAFQESFPDLAAFFEWYTAAKEAYELANPPIEVGGDGVVDMSTMPTTPG